jgi:hypothetical protein
MFGFKPKNPDAHRYYLFPGQGRGAKDKFRRHMIAALLTASVFSAALGWLLWYLNTYR